MIPKSVGLCINQTAENWLSDISTASASAIDGFALNIGAGDHFTLDALRGAYDAASKFDNFTLFLSFDFNAAGTWNVDSISNLTNTFKDEPAQFKVDGKPLVSTFEGVPFADDWKDVRKKVKGDIFLVPDWTSLGPGGISKKMDNVDGHFSFDAWPSSGRGRVTTKSDEANKRALGDKAYMMSVSPYFYTRIDKLKKNWYSSSDRLWYDRWEQVLDVGPDMVEIITWNDFGESHYIGDIREGQVIDSAKPYVDGLSHEGFRAILPYYVAAYKAGTREMALPEVMGDGVAVAWYRPTPANLTGCSDGGTKWGQGGDVTARAGVTDTINIIAVSRKDTALIISMGDQTRTIELLAGPPHYIQVPFADFGSQRGNVTITMNGETSQGPEITDSCPKSRIVSTRLSSVGFRSLC
ncbi:glycoside hydrolase [Lasiosphaeris hirsuta]|uniref:Glycoside hydrolase n=1 Tax=Lasiosphaeris hirsuta TaxID=260670 RepID=A0AA40E424_9PEZI|nr:glycoside hydrolase [Lasiosphaeris hirsuta]